VVFSDVAAAAAFLGCCVSLDFLFWSLRVNFLFDFQSIRNPSAIFVFFSLTILYLFCVLSVCEL